MRRPWLVFIESNTSGTGRLFAQTAHKMGFRPVLLTTDPRRYPYVLQDELEVRQIDTHNQQAIITQCQEFAADGGLGGITSSSEYFIPTVAAVTAHYRLPGPRLNVIQTCRDKGQQRIRLSEAQVGVPVFQRVASVEAAIAAAQSIGYPVVVKPVSGSGSMGVKLCQTIAEIGAHAEQLLSQRYNERGMPIPPQILIEEWVDGPEFSVETFGTAIVGITAKHLGLPPYFVEVGHDYPATLTPETASAVAAAAQAALNVLEFEWGPAHIELKLTKSGPKIIEVNPRLAGGFIPELVRLASGINLITETMRLVAGFDTQFSGTANHYASIRFILPPEAGILVGVHGIDTARNDPTITEVHLYPSLGTPVQRNGDFRDRIGHIIACGATPNAARTAVDRALSCVEVIVQPYEV